MATAPALMSIEEYLHTSYSPDVDFVDGEIQERHLGEIEHGRLQLLLGMLIGNHEAEWKVTGATEQRIRVAPGRVRICDLIMLNEGAPYEKVTATPPLVCIEILSPEDRISRAERVLADYLAMGVENIWLIDPVRQEAFTFDKNGLHTHLEGPLLVPGTPIQIDLEPLFARLNLHVRTSEN